MTSIPPQHNHMTRDLKPRGECPRCDAYRDYMETQAEEAPRYFYRRWKDRRARVQAG
jgi:hypothetical protein